MHAIVLFNGASMHWHVNTERVFHGAHLVLGEPSRHRGRQEGGWLWQALGGGQPLLEKRVTRQGMQGSHPGCQRSVARIAGRPLWPEMAQECCRLLLQRWELHLPP